LRVAINKYPPKSWGSDRSIDGKFIKGSDFVVSDLSIPTTKLRIGNQINLYPHTSIPARNGYTKLQKGLGIYGLVSGNKDF